MVMLSKFCRDYPEVCLSTDIVRFTSTGNITEFVLVFLAGGLVPLVESCVVKARMTLGMKVKSTLLISN